MICRSPSPSFRARTARSGSTKSGTTEFETSVTSVNSRLRGAKSLPFLDAPIAHNEPYVGAAPAACTLCPEVRAWGPPGRDEKRPYLLVATSVAGLRCQDKQ